MEANNVEIKELVPASRKLGRKEATQLVKKASLVIVAKGKKVQSFDRGVTLNKVVSTLLGPTGNLRAPTIRVGMTLLVGFEASSYAKVLNINDA